MRTKWLSMPMKKRLLDAYYEKGSDGFIALMDAFIKALYNMLLKKIEPLKVEGTTFKVRADEQRKLVNTEVPYNKMVKQLQDYTISKLRVFWTEQSEGAYANLSSAAQAELELKLKTAVATYNQRFLTLDIMKLYQHFWSTKTEIAEKFGLMHFDAVREMTQEILESGKLERKDLAALFQLKLGIEGRDGLSRYRHIFVDEAQDYSPQEFWAIRKLSENHSMTFMGDIHQGIYRHRGLKNWDDLMGGVISDLKPELYQLNDSYRSTWEIVDFANHLIEDDHLKARPVMRRGEEVVEKRCQSESELIDAVTDFIYACSERKFRTVAVICQTVAEVNQLTKYFEKRKNPYKINGIRDDKDAFEEGVSIITVDRAKGLEFDAGLVHDGSDGHYPMSDAIHKRRLYVALTRAKHYLWVTYAV